MPRTSTSSCLRACADLRARLHEGRDGGLSAALDALPAKGGGDAAGLLDALLDVGRKAVDHGPAALPTALVVSAWVLTERSESRAGWLLRGRVLEAAGDTAGAVDAYERYLAQTDKDPFGLAEQLAPMAARARHEQGIAQALARAGRPVPVLGEPPQDVEAEAAALVEEQFAALASGVPSYDPAVLTGAAEHWAGLRRVRHGLPQPDPTLGGVEWVSAGGLRDLIAGRSICLVANSGSLGAGSLGPQIDSYDVVVRFNAFRIDAAATGTRTDVHVTSSRNPHNWGVRAGTRVIVTQKPETYRAAVRERLVPGAQERVGDNSLRWPVRDLGRVWSEVWPQTPTTGFNLMWLIDFLDVSPRFDLIGFDFLESGAYRLPEAMGQPASSPADHSDEKAWVMERAQHVNGLVTSLR
ncbi:glycosyltransferase family 29 protein [Actinacidiphila yeochonensis]|uniref:glycosyltransferase family 29 protein n=1 Tax=Actinacidiphila yeochonensis TaxID=89050 RepID=UPI00068FA704|nr:glycosyltransferase family 29 protein [Actinacidiphila yeochonensis]